MTPQEAVDFIEKSAMLRILGPIGDEAWQTLKTAVSEQTAHNKQSTPLTGSDGVHCCRHCGFYTKCCVSQ